MTKACTAVLKGHYSAVTSLAISPDGWTLLSGGRDSVVMAWSLKDYTKLATVPIYEALEGGRQRRMGGYLGRRQGCRVRLGKCSGTFVGLLWDTFDRVELRWRWKLGIRTARARCKVALLHGQVAALPDPRPLCCTLQGWPSCPSSPASQGCQLMPGRRPCALSRVARRGGVRCGGRTRGRASTKSRPQVGGVVGLAPSSCCPADSSVALLLGSGCLACLPQVRRGHASGMRLAARV